jgi:DNA-binding NtrC family response regulator
VTGRILIVDDEKVFGDLLCSILVGQGYEARVLTVPEQALELSRTEDLDLVLADVRMPRVEGTDLCRAIHAERPDLPVILMTAFGTMDTAIEALRVGAFDFLPKPFEPEALLLAAGRAVEHRRLKEEVRRLRQAVSEATRFGELAGESEAMRHVFDLLSRVGPTDATVLITGESGTGKEMAARALHEASVRRTGPFVAVNCAAVPEALLESELFGHARGAFTDARQSRVGLFGRSSGGTLFLDEIAEMPLPLQPKLLRALQERTIRPVGSEEEIPIDVRVVAATNRDLDAEVEAGRFRADLYYRLDVIEVEMPPLRARGTDVLLLAGRFLETVAARTSKPVRGLSHAAAEKMLAYTWPGNVRELQNCIERAVALTRHDHVMVEDLPDRIREHRPERLVLATDHPQDLVPLETVERRYVLRVLEALGGNKKRAAQVLGLDRKTLYRKLERWGEGESGSGAEDA